MSKVKTPSFDDFTMTKAKISIEGVYCEFVIKRVVDGEVQNVEGTLNGRYQPHPDLINTRDKLREYLINAFSLNKGYDLAIKYLKGEQKEKAQDELVELYRQIEVTSISISGKDALRGAVISGKIESYNGSKCAMNTPRIVFESEKIGFEKKVEEVAELIEREVYKYLFENKKAQTDLFDDSDDEGNVPNAKDVKQPVAEGAGLQ